MVHRARMMCKDEDSLTEKKHLRTVFQNNGYPDTNIHKAQHRTEHDTSNSGERQQEIMATTSIPLYKELVRGLRECDKVGINVFFRLGRSMLKPSAPSGQVIIK